MKWLCLSCGGIYDNTLEDGMAYYHTCGAIANQNFNPNQPEGPRNLRTIMPANPRNENVQEGQIFQKAVNEQQKKPTPLKILLEGEGRQEVPDESIR